MSKLGELEIHEITFRCNVDRLLFLRERLPLDGDMAEVWMRINKVIDPLHISNHKVNSD